MPILPAFLAVAVLLTVQSFAARGADQSLDAALSAAVRSGDSSEVARLLTDGADADAGAGLPPLIVAAARGDVDIAGLLLDAGADPDVEAGQNSALIVALTRGRLDVAQRLVEAGADVNRPEAVEPGRSPLQLVIDIKPSLEAMDLLLNAGADIDRADLRGETALASAAFMDRPDAARLLIAHGADPRTTNQFGDSPHDLALERGNDAVARIIAEAGAH